MINKINILAFFGFVLSFYALYVKYKAEKLENYKPLCDINNSISCTKAFTSKYGNLIVLPNPLYGAMFYSIILILNYFELLHYVLYLAIISVIFSLYLAYISYIKQKNFCLVCTSIYVINSLFLFTVTRKIF